MVYIYCKSLFALLLVDVVAGSRHIGRSRDSNIANAQSNLGGQARSYLVKGARVQVHAGTKQSYGHAEKWIINTRGGCDEAHLEDLENRAAEFDVTTEVRGTPGSGGLCYAVVYGSEDDVTALADAVGALDPHTVIETDSEMTEVPEEDDFEDDVLEREGDSLLQKDQQGIEWGLDSIQGGFSDGVFAPTFLGAGVHIYIMDTGIRGSHTDFGGRVTQQAEFLQYPHKDCNGDLACAGDLRGHGTHVASTAGGATYGVAKEANIYAMKVLRDNGRGSLGFFVEAISYTMGVNRPGPKVASASLASTTSLSATSAVEDATNAGLHVVVAAGNNRGDACLNSPAGIPSAITVGAFDERKYHASFSNFGSCVDIMAPGFFINAAGVNSDTEVDRKSGTSMACPHVSGVVAMLLQEDPSRLPLKMSLILVESAVKGEILSMRSQVQLNARLFIAPTTPVLTPPVSVQGWVTVSGPCGHDPETECVTSPNYPNFYDQNEACTITVNKDTQISAVGFKTSRDDKLTVNGVEYHCSSSWFCTDGPQGVVATGTITWQSNAADNNRGWMLCPDAVWIAPTPAPTPAPPTTTTTSGPEC